MLTRLLLRFSALGLKFALAIVVARTLGFDAIAAYGLAVAASVIASKVLGLGFSPELNRRLSEANPLPAIGNLRRLCVVYGVLYLLLATALAVATLNDAPAALLARFGLPAPLAWSVLLVALSEHAAFEVNGWLFSLHQPRAASFLLFVRTGAWAGIACAGLLTGVVPSIDTVFAIWVVTNAFAVVASLRRIGAFAHRARSIRFPAGAVDPGGVFPVWFHGLPFYAAGVLLAALQYAERFIAGSQVSVNALGQYVFAWSIANAVQTVAFATVVATAGPRFVRTLADTPGALLRQVRRAAAASAAVTLLVSAAIAVVYRDLSAFAHEPADAGHAALLAVLLASFVLRAAADVLWAAAIALRGGAVVLAALTAIALLYLPIASQLIAREGVMGAALAHLATSVAVAAMLALSVVRLARRHRHAVPATEPHHAG
ncbi:polysaccharide biosynthesis protein [Burkholderia cepacia]|uniref:polysaccharide biosynthesis protein n=1 Tax=Burkholderia cepacia TaxID=292 RepID=UPI0007566CBB|nr:polysaccharide biosynthesis protein [Burkholderia cepacia]KVS23200.1 polysaccharide biosynthesis protein [Burkholderia cepacia]MCA8117989.1 polysaccharide biosynthesis protein [Burkholderia cepacia]